MVLNLEKVRNQQPNMTSTTDMDQYLEEIDRLKNQMTCQLSEKRCLMEQLDVFFLCLELENGTSVWLCFRGK